MICPRCNAMVPNGYALLRDRCNECEADIFVFVDMIQELRRDVEDSKRTTHLRNVEIRELRGKLDVLQVAHDETLDELLTVD